ncbi:hypothetical protein [Streptomyces sp. NPDC059816]|uniref:hypothetical protein n=1 Tax=Streptomyces sp. NPDC059816 TaxID=3346960 RepID=UPI0036667E6F
MDLIKQERTPGPERPERRPDDHGEDPGCLAVAVRLPVRLVVLALVVPARLLWDALVLTGAFLWRYGLRPLGRAAGWLGRTLVVVPVLWLVEWVLVPLCRAALWLLSALWRGTGWLLRTLVVTPLAWLYRAVLTPLGHGAQWLWARALAPLGRGVGAGLAWLLRVCFLVPLSWLWTWVLVPVGRGLGYVLYWMLRLLVHYPAVGLWRWLLVPLGRVLAVVGREAADALGHAWRIAGRISRAVGRFLGAAFALLFVTPAAWVYRTVCTPVGHLVRDALWRPAARVAREVGHGARQAFASVREGARQARADVRRMLFGARSERTAVPRASAGPPRTGAPQVPGRRASGSPEPGDDPRRTLGRSKTALTKD